MNNKIFAARRTSPLVRIWRSTGDHSMPLVCMWVQAGTAKLRPNPADSSSDETGGLRLCA